MKHTDDTVTIEELILPYAQAALQGGWRSIKDTVEFTIDTLLDPSTVTKPILSVVYDSAIIFAAHLGGYDQDIASDLAHDIKSSLSGKESLSSYRLQFAKFVKVNPKEYDEAKQRIVARLQGAEADVVGYLIKFKQADGLQRCEMIAYGVSSFLVPGSIAKGVGAIGKIAGNKLYKTVAESQVFSNHKLDNIKLPFVQTPFKLMDVVKTGTPIFTAQYLSQPIRDRMMKVSSDPMALGGLFDASIRSWIGKDGTESDKDFLKDIKIIEQYHENQNQQNALEQLKNTEQRNHRLRFLQDVSGAFGSVAGVADELKLQEVSRVYLGFSGAVQIGSAYLMGPSLAGFNEAMSGLKNVLAALREDDEGNFSEYVASEFSAIKRQLELVSHQLQDIKQDVHEMRTDMLDEFAKVHREILFFAAAFQFQSNHQNYALDDTKSGVYEIIRLMFSKVFSDADSYRRLPSERLLQTKYDEITINLDKVAVDSEEPIYNGKAIYVREQETSTLAALADIRQLAWSGKGFGYFAAQFGLWQYDEMTIDLVKVAVDSKANFYQVKGDYRAQALNAFAVFTNLNELVNSGKGFRYFATQFGLSQKIIAPYLWCQAAEKRLDYLKIAKFGRDYDYSLKDIELHINQGNQFLSVVKLLQVEAVDLINKYYKAAQDAAKSIISSANNYNPQIVDLVNGQFLNQTAPRHFVALDHQGPQLVASNLPQNLKFKWHGLELEFDKPQLMYNATHFDHCIRYKEFYALEMLSKGHFRSGCKTSSHPDHGYSHYYPQPVWHAPCAVLQYAFQDGTVAEFTEPQQHTDELMNQFLKRTGARAAIFTDPYSYKQSYKYMQNPGGNAAHYIQKAIQDLNMERHLAVKERAKFFSDNIKLFERGLRFNMIKIRQLCLTIGNEEALCNSIPEFNPIGIDAAYQHDIQAVSHYRTPLPKLDLDLINTFLQALELWMPKVLDSTRDLLVQKQHRLPSFSVDHIPYVDKFTEDFTLSANPVIARIALIIQKLKFYTLVPKLALASQATPVEKKSAPQEAPNLSFLSTKLEAILKQLFEAQQMNHENNKKIANMEQIARESAQELDFIKQKLVYLEDHASIYIDLEAPEFKPSSQPSIFPQAEATDMIKYNPGMPMHSTVDALNNLAMLCTLYAYASKTKATALKSLVGLFILCSCSRLRSEEAVIGLAIACIISISLKGVGLSKSTTCMTSTDIEHDATTKLGMAKMATQLTGQQVGFWVEKQRRVKIAAIQPEIFDTRASASVEMRL